jgi:hypothetical protein
MQTKEENKKNQNNKFKNSKNARIHMLLSYITEEKESLQQKKSLLYELNNKEHSANSSNLRRLCSNPWINGLNHTKLEKSDSTASLNSTGSIKSGHSFVSREWKEEEDKMYGDVNITGIDVEEEDSCMNKRKRSSNTSNSDFSTISEDTYTMNSNLEILPTQRIVIASMYLPVSLYQQNQKWHIAKSHVRLLTFFYFISYFIFFY